MDNDKELSPETEAALREVEARMRAELDTTETWEEVNLAPVFSGEATRPEPTILRRDDSKGLFYRNAVNSIHGDSGDGKSFVMLAASKQEIEEGRHVIWIDLEDNPDTIADRFSDLGVDAEAVLERFHHQPTEPFTPGAVQKILNEAIEYDASLIVIDSLGEAFGLEGINEDRDNEVGPWLRRVARALAEVAATNPVDHSTKAGDNPLFPSGSKRKRAAITGASYLLRAVKPLTREKGGRLSLICAKDRHGHYQRGEVAAVVDFHRYEDGGLSVKVWPPDDDTDNLLKQLWWRAKAAVETCQQAGRPLSKRELTERMPGKTRAEKKLAAIEYAVGEGALRTESGPRGSVLHSYVKPMPEPAATDDWDAE
jgi:hypothetical protein